MTKRTGLVLTLLILSAMLLLCGCGKDADNKRNPAAGGGGKEQAGALDINALTAQWAESPHSNILLAPAQRDGCVVCHDGGAFAENQTEVAAIERDFFVSIDCRACHTGQGAELMAAGRVDIPTAENAAGGTGALCMFCHNSRKAPKLDDEQRTAPHYSSQADLVSGSGGLRLEGFDYKNTDAHVKLENSCVDCHLTQTAEGFASHSFEFDNVEAACARCHQQITDENLPAAGDYDGDGDKEGFQTEVEGLLTPLQEAVTAELAGGSFASDHGKIVFKDQEGTELAKVPDELYQAAYNYLLVSSDGSLGIHNPALTVQLLQQSYKALTGQNVPQAEIK